VGFRRSSLPPDVRALLDREREPSALPAAVRARALTRARAAVVAGGARWPTSSGRAPRLRWSAAVAIACLVGGTVGATASQIRARFSPQPRLSVAARSVDAAPARPAPTFQSTPTPLGSTMQPVAATTPPTATTPTLVHASLPRRTEGRRARLAEASQSELHLLGRARGAVAREDYPTALRLLAEHTRRFRDSRLVEEREALQIKSLAGLGRLDEAVRIAVEFGVRFPHSVLLPAVVQMPAAGP
jgi:hypothetical protein